MHPNVTLTTRIPTDGVTRLIRPGLPGDLNYLYDLQNKLHDSIGWTPRGGLLERIETNRLVVIQENDLPAGYINFTHRRDKRTHISQLAVDPAIWRTQAGTEIMQHILDGARRAGSTHVTLRSALDLQCNDFWPTMGFEEVGCEQGEHRILVCWHHPLYGDAGSLITSHGDT